MAKTAKGTTKSTTQQRSSPARSSSGGSRSRAPRPTVETTRFNPLPAIHRSGRWLLQRQVLAIVLIAFAILALITLIAPSGQIGTSLATWLRQIFGWGALLLPIIAGVVGVALFRSAYIEDDDEPAWHMWGQVFGLIIALCALLAALQILIDNKPPDLALGTGGGLIGYTLWTMLKGAIGDFLAFIAVFLLMVAGIMAAARVTPKELMDQMQTVSEQLGLHSVEQPQASTDPDVPTMRINASTPIARSTTLSAALPARTPSSKPSSSGKYSGVVRPINVRQPVFGDDDDANSTPVTLQTKPNGSRSAKPSILPPPTGDGKPVRPPLRPKPISTPAPVVSVQPTPAAAVPQQLWVYPPLSSLKTSTSEALTEDMLLERAQKIVETLAHFNIPAEVPRSEINAGPTVTQFGIVPGFHERRDRAYIGKLDKGNILRDFETQRAIVLATEEPGWRYFDFKGALIDVIEKNGVLQDNGGTQVIVYTRGRDGKLRDQYNKPVTIGIRNKAGEIEDLDGKVMETRPRGTTGFQDLSGTPVAVYVRSGRDGKLIDLMGVPVIPVIEEQITVAKTLDDEPLEIETHEEAGKLLDRHGNLVFLVVRGRDGQLRDRDGRMIRIRDQADNICDVEGNILEGERTKVKVSEIMGLQNDLALALAAPTIRMEAPVPGRAVVGVEVPNSTAATVTLRDVIESDAFQKLKPKTHLAIALGKDVSGRAVAADLGKMPHLLVAGATGTGKSVLINSLISCILLHASPDEVRLLLVDPKRVEMTLYNDLPHLLSPVVVDVEKVVNTLKQVTAEMDMRYRMFERFQVRNIDAFNKKLREGVSYKNETTGKQYDKENLLPYIVVIIDELADLMMMAPEEVERLICRLAQLARATGIHLVLATQRPSVDVITGLIKANFPTRISFAVTSLVDSRTILDMAGAEKLLGRGDMLYAPTDAPKPLRLQGPFVADEEIIALVNHWKTQKKAEYAPEWKDVPASKTGTNGANGSSEDEDRDDVMYQQALSMAKQYSRISVSLLQRRLRIGYNRAARLVERLEEEGVVGPAEGAGKSREVLGVTENPQLPESAETSSADKFPHYVNYPTDSPDNRNKSPR